MTRLRTLACVFLLLAPNARVAGAPVPEEALQREPSDAAAARRRMELLRSPYAQVAEQRALCGGQIAVDLEPGVPAAARDEILVTLDAAAEELFEREGWSRPFSRRSPLRVHVARRGGEMPAMSGWEGREAGRLRNPVLAVDAGGPPERTKLDLVHQLALLSIRQVAPDEAAWLVEALAEWLARRVLALRSEPTAEGDPFLEEVGSLTWPPAATSFLEEVAPQLPRGAAEVRVLLEQIGEQRGDDAEAFLRELASRADARGLAGLLGDLVARRVGSSGLRPPEAEGGSRPSGPVPRQPWSPLRAGSPRERKLSADLVTGAPGPLGWRRIAFRTGEERGGLEVLVPETAAAAPGRVVALYRSDAGFDSIALVPGVPRTLPLSGIGQMNLILVDGPEPGELYVRLRRVPDYPVALVAQSVEWQGGAVELRWRTAAHRDLLAWVITRYPEAEDGALGEPERELLPAADAADSSYSYLYTDRVARPGSRYRYRVHALTLDGLLSEAFEASLVSGP